MSRGYKKYMKKDARRNASPYLKIFVFSFFAMLLVFTFIIKTLSPTVDTSIGDYKEQNVDIDEPKKIVDDRLQMIQSEDQGRSFSELMSKPEDTTQDNIVTQTNDTVFDNKTPIQHQEQNFKQNQKQNTAAPIPVPVKIAPVPVQEPVYKVYIGSYSSADQAKVAKDIILESGSGLNPIVKSLGTNNYTLQIGIFKNKQSADSLLYTIQQNHLPGRIVTE